MDFKTKLRTQSKAEVDAALPLKTASRQVKIGTAEGIAFPVHMAFTRAGIAATVAYPINGDNTNLGPSNPIKDFFLTKRTMREQNLASPESIEVTVTADENVIDDAIAMIQSAGRHEITAAKRPLLPAGKKAQDEPVKETVVSDQLKPVEASGTVTVGDKVYRLVPLADEVEEKAELTPEALADEVSESDSKEEEDDDKDAKEGKTADRRTIRRQDSSGNVEEIVEETDGEEEEPQVTFQAKVDPEKKLLERLALAEIAVELGIVKSDDKMAFVAELEGESDEAVEARKKMLASVKEAGLSKTATKRTGMARIPRLERPTLAVTSSANGAADDGIPFEAVFLSE